MSGYSLLKRIRDPALAAPRRIVTDAEVRTGVLDNLRAMFATRLGSVLTCPDYGIVSVTDIVHSCPDAIEDILRSIRHTIRTYEPRLVAPVVRYLEGDAARGLTIRFEISGQLANGDRRTPVKFESVIDATRTVRVE